MLELSSARAPEPKFLTKYLPSHEWYAPDYYRVFLRDNRGGSVAEVDFDVEHALIQNFRVKPELRGQGLGREVMTRLLAAPPLKSFLKPVFLNAKPYGDLTNAIEQSRLEAFYESFGFTKTGVYTDKGTQMELRPHARRLALVRR